MEKPFKGKCSTLFHWNLEIKIRVDLSFAIYKTKPLEEKKSSSPPRENKRTKTIKPNVLLDLHHSISHTYMGLDILR